MLLPPLLPFLPTASFLYLSPSNPISNAHSCGGIVWISPVVHAHVYEIKTPTASGSRTDKGWKVAIEEDLAFSN